MNKMIRSVAAGILIITIVVTASCNSHQTAKTYFGDAESMGSEEDADGYMQYEWMRLRDPETGQIPAHMREKELAFAATLPNSNNLAQFKLTSAAWQARGPWNVGGRTRAFGIDVTNSNTLIAGTPSGGMWRSTDGGSTWTATTPINSYQGATCLAQDTRPGHTSTWYFGTGEYYGGSASAYGAAYSGNGIYKSTDNGMTWAALSSTTSPLSTFTVWGDYVWNIVTDQSNTTNDVVYAAAYGGIYRSTDGGANWTIVKGTLASTDSRFTDVAITSTGVVYATLSSDGVQKGLYRSTDGTNFTDITPAGFPASYNRIKIGISPSDENQVFFLGNTPGSGKQHVDFQGNTEWNSLWKYKYVSGDGSGTGGVWKDLSINIPATGGAFDKFQTQGSYDIVIKVKPNDTNTIFIGGTNLFRSTSGFEDSTHTTFIGGYQLGAALPVVQLYANHHPDQHDLVFLPGDPNKMISANDGGVFRTDDNTASTIAWTPLNNGYISSMFYTCAIDHAATNDIVIGGAQDNGSWYTNSANLTTPWVTPRGGDGSYCAIADNQSAYYFSIQNGKMMRAELDASGSVTKFARIDPIGATGVLFINPFVLDPNNNNIMYMAGGANLWRNDNLSGIPYASNWDSITTNWTKLPKVTSQITAVAVSTTPANRVYYGTSSKLVCRIDNAHTGTPTAANVSLTNFPSATVSCIAIDPSNADNAMVVFSNYGVYSLFYTSNGGTSWDHVAGNLEDSTLTGAGNGPSCRWAKIIPTSDGTVYLVGTSTGLYATTQLNSYGTYWTQQAPNEIGNSVVEMIDYRATDGLTVVATHSHGIFSTHITSVNDVVGIKQLNAANQGYEFTNYPNPFKTETTIRFTIHHKEKVRLEVHDELGRLVKILNESVLEPGEKQFTFNGSGLVPGTYYCTLKTPSHFESKKMILVK